MTIALDAMGGDYGPSVVVPAALDALALFQDVNIILVGHRDTLSKQLKEHQADSGPRLQIHHADEVVGMEDSPSFALRSKKQSSMRLAIDLVHNHVAHACVSAGNTGALMAIARFVLRTLPGIDRPAIVYSMPTQLSDGKIGSIRVLDLGANVDCQGEHLFQFAVMGSELTAAVDNVASPRVGLLNIGSEAIKGSEAVKHAAQRLQDT
ncbi:MAG TPA: phosphate acyltransferase, partial [Gammaproteobacteria bacterium]|nr:phosphate acyltransferase [Gammaproteobacteria bacterium]